MTQQNLGAGITLIDARYIREGLAAIYIVRHGDEVAIIETGTRATVPDVEAFLKANNIVAEQVRYIIPTHVHLDHSAGAGVMMQLFPEAKLVAHPKGARHLIDPAKLVAGAKVVYGEDYFNRMYGEILPIAEERVIVAEDGHNISLAGRILEFRETPGHANHHFCIWDEQSRSWFSGDVFGLLYPEFRFAAVDYVIPTTTPDQFDPDALQRSIELLVSYQPHRILLTHYGELTSVTATADSLHQQIARYIEIARSCQGSEQRVTAIEKQIGDYTRTLVEQHLGHRPGDELMALLAMDINLNAQGLDVWLARQEKQ